MARFNVKPDKREVAEKAIVEFIDAIQQHEEGTLLYQSLRENDGVSFVHFMTFKDEKAEEIHRSTPHVKKFVDILYPNCEQRPVFTDLTSVASAGKQR